MPEKKYARPSNKLIIGGTEFHIDHPTFNFRDTAEDQPGFDGSFLGRTRHSASNAPPGPGLPPYAAAQGLEGKVQRYRSRHYPPTEKPSYNLAKALIKQFVVHLDGCQDAEMCFNVLHNERGLSCHFILGNDGVIYQTLDLLDCAYHASGMNETSIGIEMCNRGNAALYPTYYDAVEPEYRRDKVVCNINNEKYVAYDFTKKQYEGMIVLGKTLARLLPGIKLTYPQSANGEQRWDTIDKEDKSNARLRESFSGYLGHYHVTNQKWDPGPFDFKRFISKLSGHRTFPMGLPKLANKIEVPDAPTEKSKDAERKGYEAAFQVYYENNEFQGAGGGFFPVGPLEATRLWHGGIHLHADEGTKVYAPLPGRVMVARNGRIDGVTGSTNFVLLSHNLGVGGETLSFFSLYYHLDEEKPTAKKDQRPKWMANEMWQEGERGKTTDLGSGEPVQAGELIGRVGLAGVDPPEGQMHWEIFSADFRVVTKLDKNRFWIPVSGANDQRFCTNPDVISRIDKSKDGLLSTDELLEAYRDDVDYREWTHHVVASHYSEWSDSPSWEVALQGAPEFARHPADALRIYNEQILPGLWMNAQRAQSLGLSVTAPIYTYHPVTFLKWVNGLLRSSDEPALRKATQADIATASRSGMVDFDDKLGVANVELAEVSGKPVQQIDLQDMVDGYGD